MNKNLKSNNDKSAGENSIVFRLFSVINGLVPLIWVQRVTYLVNKFASLFKRSMLNQDCRNTSGNDGCWRRWLSACCNVFKYPSPDTNVSTSPARGEVGRSMIEMLGVLAIIGVLSVGGIAGYSKAMEKWKVNKSVEQYNYMIAGLLEHLEEFKNRSSSICSVWGIRDWSYCGLKSYLRAAHLVPDDWQDSVDNLLVDSNGNVISVFSRGGRLVIDMHIGGFAILQDGTGKTPHFPVDMCRHILNDVAKPLQDVIQFVWVYKSGKNNPKFYGKSYCPKNSKCLRDITLNEINTECSGCTPGTKSCSVTFEF